MEMKCENKIKGKKSIIMSKKTLFNIKNRYAKYREIDPYKRMILINIENGNITFEIPINN